MYDKAFLEELRAALPVIDVVRRRHKLRKVSAHEWAAVDNPSLKVNDAKNTWADWGSNGHDPGDIFDFWQWSTRCEFRQAVEELAQIAGIASERGTDGSERHGPNGQARAAPRRQIVATYDYVDADGAMIYQVVKYKPKSFAQRRPLPGEGKWIWGLTAGTYVRGRNGDFYSLNEDRKGWKGERRAFDAVAHGLYRFDELRELMIPDPEDPEFRPIISIPEGEADCETLRRWGLFATTNSGGAGNWQPYHAEYLRGANVIILLDNDTAGRKRGDTIGKSLHNVAKSVRVLDWKDHWPDAPKGADVTDWRDRVGGTGERLCEIVDNLPEWKPPADGAGTPDTAATLKSMRASTVAIRAIQWIWPGRFAVGKLGLLVGLPDEGKGQILCYVAATITNGGEWPGGEGRAPKGRVILLTAEDDIADTVNPRLLAAGANLNDIEIVRMVQEKGKDRMFNLASDLDLLRKKITEVGDVKMVLIDPVSAYLGVKKMDSFRTTDVRAVLGPVTDLAAEMMIGFLGIMHFNKKVDVTNALLRISDSMAFGATSRHAYAVVDDPENKRKLLVKAKNNLAPRNQKALAYDFGTRNVGSDPQTGQEIWAPYILWHPHHVDVTATEAMRAANESKSPAARDDAKKFLETFLAEGPKPKTEIEEAADANCISERTLRRAKTDLGVMAKKDGPDGSWTWRLPPAQTWRRSKDND
jgi:hypothetical protein